MLAQEHSYVRSQTKKVKQVAWQTTSYRQQEPNLWELEEDYTL